MPSSLREQIEEVDRAYAKRRQERASSQRPAFRKYNPEQSTLGYLANEAKLVPAGLAGMLPDLVYNARDLAKGVLSVPFAETDRPIPESYEIRGPKDTSVREQLLYGRPGGAGTYADVLGYAPKTPAGPVQDATGKVQNALLMMALMKKTPGAGLERLPWGQTAAIGTGAGLGQYAGKEALPNQPLAEIGGAVVGGAIPALAPLSPTVAAINALKGAYKKATDPAATQKSQAVVEAIVKKQIENDLAGQIQKTPGAIPRTEQSLAMARNVPGTALDIGQASGVPSIIDQVKTAAIATGVSKNAKLAADTANRQAVAEALLKGKPQTELGDVVTKQVGLAEGRKQALESGLAEAERSRSLLSSELPRTAKPEALGKQAKAIRSLEKEQADIQVKQMLDEVQRSAGDKTFDVNSVLEVAAKVKEQPIFTYAPERMPKVFARLEALRGESQTAAPAGLSPIKQKTPAAPQEPPKVPFAELRALREAVNEDLRDVSVAGSTVARSQRRELNKIKSAIDEEITSQGGETAQQYGDFVKHYRDVYAPRFLQGVNIKQTLKDVTGSERIPYEALFGHYFKKSSPTAAKSYLDLYGKNPDAKLLMRDAILDRYRKEAVNPHGDVTDAAHARFMKNYEAPLRILKDGGIPVADELSTIGNASAAITSRMASLKAEKDMLAQDKFLKVVSDTFGARTPDKVMADVVKDPRQASLLVSNLGRDGAEGMLGWMADDFANTVKTSPVETFGSALSKQLEDKTHLAAYRTAFEQAHGKAAADAQVARLQELADLSRRMQSTEIEPSSGVTHIGSMSKYPLMEKTGFSARTVMSLVRAIVTKRSSEYDMVAVLGGQFGLKEVDRIRQGVIQESLKNPEMLRDILTLAKQGPQDTGAVAAAKTVGNAMRGYVGGALKDIHPSVRSATPAIVESIEAEQVKREQKGNRP